VIFDDQNTQAFTGIWISRSILAHLRRCGGTRTPESFRRPISLRNHGSVVRLLAVVWRS